MKTLILQNVSTKEIRTVVQAVALADKNEYYIIRSDIDDLEKYSEELRSAIPVGSVEFVRKAMEIAGFKEPMIDPYPLFVDEEHTVFRRKLQLKKHINNNLSEFEGKFVKPFRLKEFNGFVYDSSDTSEYTIEQKNQFLKTENYIWVCDPVDFLAEWRYYIRNGHIVGYARYDENEEEIQEPDGSLIQEYISKLSIEHPYVLDFGVLPTGETALVEYNDFWAIGLYEDALSPKVYLEMLIERIESIRRNQ